MVTKKRAIYPGSFDPMTYGHVDIALRSLKIFDELIIAVGSNSKKKSLFTPKERVEQIEEVFKGVPEVSVVTFDGLMVDLARELNIFTVVRGLRAISDFEFEFQLSAMNRKLEPRMELFFMMTGEKHFYVSSSVVKEIASMGGDVSEFIPGNIKDAIDLK